MIVDRGFGFFLDKVIGKGKALLGSNIGGRITTDAVTDSVNMLGRSFEILINGDTSVFELNTSIIKTKINIGLTASGEYDVRNANHFFAVAEAKNDIFASIVFTDGDDFASVEDGGTEFFGEIIGEGEANFGIFAGKNALVHVEENNFGAEFGIVGSDFATSGASSDDSDDFGEMASLDGGFGGEIISSVKTRDFGGFEMGASSKDEMTSGEFFGFDGDSVGIKKISETIKTNNARFF